MTGGQIYIRLVVGVTPDVVTDGRVHVLARGVQIFLVAFDLVNEGRFRDGDPDLILFASLLRRWRRRISGREPARGLGFAAKVHDAKCERVRAVQRDSLSVT